MEHIGTALAAVEYPHEAPAKPDISDEERAPDGGPLCPYCRGYRWVRFDVQPGHPQFGRPARCEHCRDQVATTLLNQAASNAGLAIPQMRLRFDSFTPAKPSKAAFDAARTFAAKPEGWLVLHGQPGCGKTHLALAVANARILGGLRVRFWYVPELVLRLKLELHEQRSPEQFMLGVRDEPLLILDDLWAARPTDWVLESLEQLFNYRYVERLPTLVTMIGSPEEVKGQRSESIGRRMQDTSICRAVHNAAPQWTGG